MRILVINAPGELCRELQQRSNLTSDLQILIAAPSNPLVPGDGFTKFVPFSSRRKIDLKAIRSLRRTIQEFQPDVVHSFLPRSLAQTVLACTGLRKRPRIVSFYGITRVPSWKEPADWITYLSSKVSMHACESQAVKQALMQGGVPEHKCEVVYNCVDGVSSASVRQQLRTQFDIPQNAFVIGSVATIRPIKGIDVLMRALIRNADLPNTYTLIAGPVDDPVVAKLAQDERISSRVKLLGYTPNAVSIMQAMDVFVMPSRKEGLCRALLEAMGQSVCPIVSDAGGMKEIVRNGIDGIVFPSEDDLALSKAIAHLQANPALMAQFGASALARVKDMCAPQVVGERVLKLYERLAA